jgi:hypothetical protein
VFRTEAFNTEAFRVMLARRVVAIGAAKRIGDTTCSVVRNTTGLRAVRSCRPTWRRREVPLALSLPTFTPWSAVGEQGLLTAARTTAWESGNHSAPR